MKIITANRLTDNKIIALAFGREEVEIIINFAPRWSKPFKDLLKMKTGFAFLKDAQEELPKHRLSVHFETIEHYAAKYQTIGLIFDFPEKQEILTSPRYAVWGYGLLKRGFEIKHLLSNGNKIRQTERTPKQLSLI